jgi:predicted peroxiredoxin
MNNAPEFGLQVIIASGPRDIERATLGFAMAVASASSGIKVVIFLTMEGVMWADELEDHMVQVEGFERITDYVTLLQEAGARLEACTSCVQTFCPSMKRTESSKKIRDGFVLAGLSTAAIRASKIPTVVY